MMIFSSNFNLYTEHTEHTEQALKYKDFFVPYTL